MEARFGVNSCFAELMEAEQSKRGLRTPHVGISAEHSTRNRLIALISLWIQALIRWRQPYPSNDRAVALIGVQKIVRRVELEPEQERGVLAKALLKKRQGHIAVVELRV